MIRVFHKGTKERFWIFEADKGLLSTNRTIEVFKDYAGCRRLPGGMGFACNRSSRIKKQGIKFKASFIKKLPQSEIDKEDKEMMDMLDAEIKRQMREEAKKGLNE